MEENFKNKLGFWMFFVIVLFLAIGGYFFTDYILNVKEEVSKNNKKEEKINYKIDEEKDYVYFQNEKSIIDEDDVEVYYKDVIINIKGQENITEILENENKKYQGNIKYLSDMELLSEDIITYNYNNIYALTFREYKVYEYNDYVSLVIDNHNYSCFDLNSFASTKSYVFDISEGKLLTNEDVLNLYDVNMNHIINKIKEKLTNDQQVVDEVELIKIDETINDLNYSLYINEYGRLYISFLVKTTQVDYNEIMEV